MLYLVATPIGNLEDMTFRAVRVLRECDVIACEDTRHTRKLLNHYDISARLVSYHEHNEAERADELIKLLLEGKKVAVVSDAGTPAICDPSFRIVQKAIENGIKVESIPGAVAFVNALIISGLPTDSMFFGGFLPSKTGERQARLREVGEWQTTICFYETPHRLRESLHNCLEILGNRKACVVRELTKLHEEAVRGDFNALIEHFRENEPRGEMVLIIDREKIVSDTTEADSETLTQMILRLESEGIERRAALKQAAKHFGLPRAEAYRIFTQNRDS